MELLGTSIEDLFQKCDCKFGLKTVLMLSEQMINRIEYMHDKGYIHRDIKPDNFMTGVGKNKNTIYIIDLGLAKKYRDNYTGEHIIFKEGKSLTGTARYASLNTHLGYEQSRRDDLEALVMLMIYLMLGKLPWQGIKAKNIKEKYEKIKIKRLETSYEELCKDLPSKEILLNIINYIILCYYRGIFVFIGICWFY